MSYLLSRCLRGRQQQPQNRLASTGRPAAHGEPLPAAHGEPLPSGAGRAVPAHSPATISKRTTCGPSAGAPWWPAARRRPAVSATLPRKPSPAVHAGSARTSMLPWWMVCKQPRVRKHCRWGRRQKGVSMDAYCPFLSGIRHLRTTIGPAESRTTLPVSNPLSTHAGSVIRCLPTRAACPPSSEARPRPTAGKGPRAPRAACHRQTNLLSTHAGSVPPIFGSPRSSRRRA